MKLKSIVILAILAIVLAGSAFAFDLNFLNGSNEEVQEVTVGGIDFNIPAGFSQNENYTLNHENLSSDDFEYYVSSVAYEDGSKQNAIFIMVADYGANNVSDDVIKDIGDSMDAENKTVNGHDGYLVKQNGNTGNESLILKTVDDDYVFIYEENGDLVYIGTSDTSYLDQIIKK